MALLEVNEITKRFGGLVAVNDFSLNINNREIVALIGPNGAGKTTAFNVIAGVYDPDGGKVIFDGRDISKSRPDQVCKLGITRTFQVVRPFAGINVLDNVMIGAYARTSDKRVAQAKAEEVLEFLEMEDLANQMASSLPIGGRKRLEIARALATEPQVILLDEVMAGLRPAECEKVIEMVRKMSTEKGIAILLVEHVMKVVMSLAERIVVLHHGVKIAEGTPGEIVKNQQVIDAYLGEETHVES